MMAYDYEGYLNKIKEYCSSNEEMKTAVDELENIISVMYKKLKRSGDGFNREDYTREELMHEYAYKIDGFYFFYIKKIIHMYCSIFEENDIYYDNAGYENIFFENGNVRFECSYEIREDEKEYFNIILTEDEFFNEDLESPKERFYKEVEIAKRKEKEKELITLKNDIERQRDKLNKLISEYENLNNDVHDNEKR